MKSRLRCGKSQVKNVCVRFIALRLSQFVSWCARISAGVPTCVVPCTYTRVRTEDADVVQVLDVLL